MQHSPSFPPRYRVMIYPRNEGKRLDLITDNNNSYTSRPTREAAIQGISTRRITESTNRKIDKQLNESMGTSKGYYSKTKAGGNRKEYQGK